MIPLDYAHLHPQTDVFLTPDRVLTGALVDADLAHPARSQLKTLIPASTDQARTRTASTSLRFLRSLSSGRPPECDPCISISEWFASAPDAAVSPTRRVDETQSAELSPVSYPRRKGSGR